VSQADSATTPAPLQGTALLVVAVALALGTFMQVLDSTIANVALNTIAGNLGEASNTAIWVITAFAVANGVTVPLTGWLTRSSPRWRCSHWPRSYAALRGACPR